MKELKEDYTTTFGTDCYSNSYHHSIICDNCNHKNNLEVRKGVFAPDVIECERCGCDTTNRKAVRDIDKKGPWIKKYEKN